MTIIKTIIDEIVTPFTYICNQSILSGTFPNKMKLAKVIPLYKNGNHNVFTNYRPVSYYCIKSYLCERKQYVSVNSCNSEAMNVVCGVPQGSILGPKLFILYVNDICNVSSLLRFVLFADDTNIFLSGDDVKEISNTLSKQLDKLNSWFAANKLSLNVSKTNYMIFGNTKI